MKHIEKIIIIAFAVTVLFLGANNILYSDEASYASAGLNLIGYQTPYDPVLPVFLPFVFAFFFFVKMEFVAVHILIPLLAIASAILVYKITEDVWNKKTALIALILFATSGKIMLFSGQFLTEMPTVFFLLFAFYAFRKKYFKISALATFLAITVRWFNAILAIPFIFLLLFKKKYKELAIYLSALMIMTLALLIYFYISHGDMFYPMNQLNVRSAYAEHPILTNNPLLYNVYYIIFTPYIFTIPGCILLLYAAFKNRKMALKIITEEHYFIMLGVIILNIIAYSIPPYRIARYLFISAPFGLMLVSMAIATIENKKAAIVAFSVILIFNIFANAYPDDMQTGMSEFFNNNIPKEDVQNTLNLSRHGIPVCETEAPKNFTRFDGFKNITEKIGNWDGGYYTLGTVNQSC